jgi:hypothetical protein
MQLFSRPQPTRPEVTCRTTKANSQDQMTRPLHLRVMVDRAITTTWGTRASHDVIIVHRHAPATPFPSRCKARRRSLVHPTFLRFLSKHHDPNLGGRLYVHLQRWEIAARNLQDLERLQSNIRRHTGIHQRTVWSTHHSSQGKRTGGFMFRFGFHRGSDTYT